MITTIKAFANEFAEACKKNFYRENEPLPSEYQLTINDRITRTNKIITFYNLKECMDFVNAQYLMYDRDKEVFVIQVNHGSTNHVLRLSSIKTDIHEEIQNFYAAEGECYQLSPAFSN